MINRIEGQRCERFLQGAKDEIDALVIQSQPNMRYFSGFTGDSGGLIISGNQKVLLTDFRYTEQAREEARDFEVVECARGEYLPKLYAVIADIGARSIGFEDETLMYADANALISGITTVEWKAVSTRIMQFRMIKDETELVYLKRAGEIADMAFLYAQDTFYVGMTEKEMALQLECFMRENGAQALSFPIIAASGENGSRPHAVPTHREIRRGDMLTLDFGCIVEGYCSDMTRTIGFGTLASEQENVYNICLEAQMRACEAARVGLRGRQLDAIAREHIDQHGYGACFGHSLGHGVGLDIHEQPNLSMQSETILAPNMVFSIEPGIYCEGKYGVRIEDFGVLTPNGYQSFIHSPKELICLP